MTDITIYKGGVKLAASIHGPADAPPILFIHGISLSRDGWGEMTQRLAGRFQVWTLDLRGHGHSDRTADYDLAGYVSDAAAALDAIGRPAVAIGHSLGGVVAGVLAQTPHPNLLGAVLEDPPWFMGEPAETTNNRTIEAFSWLSAMQAGLQARGAPLSDYLRTLSNTPSPLGGKASDHYSPRQMLCWASAVQRQDNRCWEGAISGTLLAPVETGRPFARPVKVIQADPRLGAALLDGHEQRMAKTNPDAEIIRYDNAVHTIHMIPAFENRFAADIAAFASKVTG
ncbi:MAG: alpha/beta hydrolase [Caulobacteraceae bacterium]